VVYERRQRTLAKAISYSGIGLHTAQQVHMRFCPAKEVQGIVFKRVDLKEKTLIPAKVALVCQTERSTTIGIGDVKIHTVEHVLASSLKQTLFLPIGGMLIALFTGWVLDKEIAKKEFLSGTSWGWLFAPWLFFIRWIVPLAIGLIILQQSGLIQIDTLIKY